MFGELKFGRFYHGSRTMPIILSIAFKKIKTFANKCYTVSMYTIVTLVLHVHVQYIMYATGCQSIRVHESNIGIT